MEKARQTETDIQADRGRSGRKREGREVTEPPDMPPVLLQRLENRKRD
jgi:hypothetical protein